METILRKIDKLGRVVLPMDFRKVLGLEARQRLCFLSRKILLQ